MNNERGRRMLGNMMNSPGNADVTAEHWECQTLESIESRTLSIGGNTVHELSPAAVDECVRLQSFSGVEEDS